jgi:hypothetical protein
MPVVSNRATLFAALNACVGGETIFCEPGNYGRVDYYSTGGAPTATTLFPSEVKIRAKDTANPPIFDEFYLGTVQNITLEYIKFKWTSWSGAPNYNRPNEVISSTNIKFKNCIFEGDFAFGQTNPDDNGWPSGYGLFAFGTNGLLIERCKFFKWLMANIITQSQNITTQFCEFHTNSSDGMQLSGVTTSTIRGNYLHDWMINPISGAHPDAIQYHTNTQTVPNTDILIENNVIKQNAGDWSQSIFMGNEAITRPIDPAGPEMRYNNVTIRNNLIVNGHLHGISCDNVDNITVDNNTVAQSANPYTDNPIVGFPTINITNATASVISDNVVSTLNGVNSSDGTKTNNIVRQWTDSGGANYYANLVTGAYDGSALAALGAGASFVQEPVFQVPAVDTWSFTTV